MENLVSASEKQNCARPVFVAAGSQMDQLAQALLAAGALIDNGTFYSTTTPELRQVADTLNQERIKRSQEENAKSITDALNPVVDSLRQELQTLKNQLQQNTPKVHERWLDQHGDYLRVKDNTGRLTNALTPAGALYDKTWTSLQAQGVTDENILHTAAAAATTSHWSFAAANQQPAQPQPTFMQSAASSQLQPNPGFNLPGSTVNATTGPQSGQPLLVTPRGYADWDAIGNAMANGTLQ